MADGIRDKTVVLGMGCSRFGERWDASAADLVVEAVSEALADAGGRAGRDRSRLARRFLRRTEHRQVGDSAVECAEAPERAGHAGRESLCDRDRGVSRCRLCRCVRGRRYRAGRRRRKAQGHRVSAGFPSEPMARFEDLVAAVEYGARSIRAARERLLRTSISISAWRTLQPRDGAHLGARVMQTRSKNDKAHLQTRAYPIDDVLNAPPKVVLSARCSTIAAGFPMAPLRRSLRAPKSRASWATPTSSAVKSIQLAISNGVEAYAQFLGRLLHTLTTRRLRPSAPMPKPGSSDPAGGHRPDRGS